MQLTFALLAALCLSVPVLSQNENCKTIAGAANFNFTEFISNTYYYILGTDTPEVETYASAIESAELVGDKYVTTFSVISNDGSQYITRYLITSVNGATITESLLSSDDDTPTDTNFTITFYAFKPKKYAQFYVCGPTETDKDLRFAILYGNKKLKRLLKKELETNDDKFGFKGNLIPLGRSNGHTEPEDD